MAEQRTRFLGTFEHGLDDKGRMVLPAKIRAQLGETGVVAKLDGCLGLWTLDGFVAASDQFEERVELGEATTGALRRFIADAYEITPDQQGRIGIPKGLRTYADLGTEVVITGRMKRAEIWDAQKWAGMSDEDDADLTTAVKTLRL